MQTELLREPPQHLLADCGVHTLEIECAADADLDGTFEATCLDTGERLKINGWLWTFEPLDDDA
jgi:hypothetical protein